MPSKFYCFILPQKLVTLDCIPNDNLQCHCQLKRFKQIKLVGW